MRYAAGFRTPEHCDQSLCRFTQGREHVWMPHRGHLYLRGLVWHIAQSSLRRASALSPMLSHRKRQSAFEVQRVSPTTDCADTSGHIYDTRECIEILFEIRKVRETIILVPIDNLKPSFQRAPTITEERVLLKECRCQGPFQVMLHTHTQPRQDNRSKSFPDGACENQTSAPAYPSVHSNQYSHFRSIATRQQCQRRCQCMQTSHGENFSMVQCISRSLIAEEAMACCISSSLNCDVVTIHTRKKSKNLMPEAVTHCARGKYPSRDL